MKIKKADKSSFVGTTSEQSTNADFGTSASLLAKPNVVRSFLKSVKNIFHTHNVIEFKVGRWPLVAGYCSTCGCVFFGNAVFYDGTYFQHKYKNKQASEFVLDKINYVQNRIDSLEMYKMMGFSINAKQLLLNEAIILSEYETVSYYKHILDLIEGLRFR